MKRSEFKAIVKECLVEILRDNQELFVERKAAPKRTATKKKATKSTKIKRSLMNLVQEQKQPQRPRPTPQQPVPQQPSGPPSAMDMIRSAADTMNQQNAQGEMSSRAYTMPSMQGQQPIVDEDYVPYAVYEGVPQESSSPAQVLPQGAPDPSPQITGEAAMDGESHWSKLAFDFFDK